MPDREKVMQWLETCVSGCEDGCPYEYKNLVYRVECKADLMRDALALLKEQEPVEPVPEHPVVINTLACGVCHTQVARWDTVRGKRVYLFKAKYCPECGRKVKWSDEDRPD